MSWKILIVLTITMLLTPIIITGTTAMLGSKAKDIVAQEWGLYGQLYVGGLGTCLHEAGHALMALLFGHRIVSLKLCRFKHLNDPEVKTLGYVTHTYRDTYYQTLGNFFIGIAPFFSCTGFLMLIHHWLFGTRYHFNISINTGSVHFTAMNVLLNCWTNIKQSLLDDVQHPLCLLIFFILIVMVSVTGYAISVQDWKSTLCGFTQYLVLAIIASLVIMGLGLIDTQFQFYAWDFVAALLFLMVDSWLYVLSSIALLYGIKYAVYHGHIHYQLTKPHVHVIDDLKRKLEKYL